jgi:CDP-paratose 2-epimerase
LKFDSPYGCSKGAADQYAMDYAVTYGLKTVTLRQSCIYGDFQYGVEDQGWVAWFAIQALLGRGLTVYGNGQQVRDLLYVGDLVELYVKLIESKDKINGQAYNIGGGLERTLSLNALINLLNARLQINMDVAYSSPRRGDQNVYISDIGKIGEEFNWHPSTSVEKGVGLLLNWLTDNIELVRLSLSSSSSK